MKLVIDRERGGRGKARLKPRPRPKKNKKTHPFQTPLLPPHLSLPPPSQRHLLRGRRHLRRHRRHHLPDQDRVRRQEKRRDLAGLGLHERLRSAGRGPDDGVGQPRVRPLRRRRRLLRGAVGRGQLDAVREDPGGGDLRVRAGALRGDHRHHRERGEQLPGGRMIEEERGKGGKGRGRGRSERRSFCLLLDFSLLFSCFFFFKTKNV